MASKSAKLPRTLMWAHTFPFSVSNRFLTEGEYPQAGDVLTDGAELYKVAWQTANPLGWMCHIREAGAETYTKAGALRPNDGEHKEWIGAACSEKFHYASRADSGALTCLHEMYGVFFDELPPDQKEPFGKWMGGQTCGVHPESGKPFAYYWDYEDWYDAWVKGKVAKVYD